MPSVRIVLNGEGAFPELKDGNVRRGLLSAVTALPGGMSSGKSSVGMIVEMEDGERVFCETSLELFYNAACALQAKHGG